jgi:hypothetical protein
MRRSSVATRGIAAATGVERSIVIGWTASMETAMR